MGGAAIGFAAALVVEVGFATSELDEAELFLGGGGGGGCQFANGVLSSFAGGFGGLGSHDGNSGRASVSFV